LTIPVDPDQPVQLGRGYDTLAGLLRGDAVLSDNQTETVGGGQKTTYSMQSVTSLTDLKARLEVSASGSFGRLWGTADARVEFVGSLNVNRYYTYLLVHCTVENATTLLGSYDVNDDVKAFVGTANPNMNDFYDKWGDTFVASYVSGGEFIGLVEFQTETDEAQASLAAQINVIGGSWSAGSDFKAQMDKLSQTTQTSVSIYMNGSAQSVPSLDQMVDFALAFPDKVNPDKGGKPMLYSIVVMDYDAALPVGKHGPSLDRADDLLEQYGQFDDRLTLAANSLAFIAQYRERFQMSNSEIQSLQDQIASTQTQIDEAVRQLKDNPVNTTDTIPAGLEASIEQIEASIPTARSPLYSGWPIALQADTGQYLCRSGAFGFQITKDAPDESCWLSVTVRNDGEIALQADTARFLSREGAEDVEFTKDVVDQYCWFTPFFNQSGQLALQADSALYLSRMGAQDVQASKGTPDQFCWFTTRANTTTP
jgi:hypothetical protein